MELKSFHFLLLVSFLLFIEHGAKAKPTHATMNNQVGCPPDGTCCMQPSKIFRFKPPPKQSKLRVRRPAHLVDKEYRRKYARAIRLMKSLNDSHPWSLTKQGGLHCAYAMWSMHIVIHNTWFFFPFHRAYLYFYERILGKLLGDGTFALPFWNWDTPRGMTFPKLYLNRRSPVYDETRNLTNLPPNVLEFVKLAGNFSINEQIEWNLELLYRQIVDGGKDPSLFLGSLNTTGNFEKSPHGPVHSWSGENMKEAQFSANDPIFFAHHSNVDRLWEIWRGLPGRQHDFTDPNWLNSSFLFYDENMRLVRIKVRDVLDMGSLGYTYEDVPKPWLDKRSTPRQLKVDGLFESGKSLVIFPLTLTSSPVRVTLGRFDIGLESADLKKKGKEVLAIKGIKYDTTQVVHFDIYVSSTKALRSAATSAKGTMPATLAGCFTWLPMKHSKFGGQEDQQLIVDLHELLAGMGAEHEKMITVTLMPSDGSTKVEIGSVEIAYIS